jgi:hypothetical protein
VELDKEGGLQMEGGCTKGIACLRFGRCLPCKEMEKSKRMSSNAVFAHELQRAQVGGGIFKHSL